jgi:hypothetical protein
VFGVRCDCCWWRKFSRVGRGLPSGACTESSLAGSRKRPRQEHVAIFGPAHRADEEHRGVHQHGDSAAWAGEGHLDCVEINNDHTHRSRWVPATAVCTFIGLLPHTSWLPKEIETDQRGFVKIGFAVGNSPFWSANRPPHFLETSHPCVFAVGDVRSSSMKRVASAVGEGAMAVAFVHASIAACEESLNGMQWFDKAAFCCELTSERRNWLSGYTTAQYLKNG